MLSVWHYTPAAMTLPSLRLSRVSGGSNGKIVLQVPAEMAGSSPIIQRNQPVQQDLQASLAFTCLSGLMDAVGRGTGATAVMEGTVEDCPREVELSPALGD